MINKINRFKSFYLIQFDSNSIFFLLFQCLFCQIKDGVYRVLDYNDAQRAEYLRSVALRITIIHFKTTIK